MKKVLLFFTFALLATAINAQFPAVMQSADADLIKVGDKMPAFNIVKDNGTTISSATLKGKIVLINFFATWCGPCQRELAEVQKTLWPKYKDNAHFAMLVIGREHSDADLTEYNKTKGFTFPLYADKNRAIYGKFATNMIPRSFLIDKSGKVIYSSIGFTPEDFNKLMKQIEKALK